MERGKIARMALVKRRVRDACRSELARAKAALVVVEEEIATTEALARRTHEAIGAASDVSIAELEQRVDAARDCHAKARALEVTRVTKIGEVEAAQLERIEAEREVKMLEHAEARAAASELASTERRESAELDDRAAARRRIA